MERVGPYQLVKLLGKGAYGNFYSATDTFNQHIGIKMTASHFDDSIKEAEILERLTFSQAFDYVPHYYDRFYSDGKLYVAMELVDGITLTEFIKRGVPQPKILWDIFTQLILGLKAIHDNNIAHRDIKPDNIIITKENAVKYIDFGFACSSEDVISGTFGTPIYQPPEILRKYQKPTIEHAKLHDIWSLSLVMFNIANGRLPFIDNGIHLDMKQFITILSELHEVDSCYSFDDGRTNVFLNMIVEVDVYQRLDINSINMLYHDIVMGPEYP